LGNPQPSSFKLEKVQRLWVYHPVPAEWWGNRKRLTALKVKGEDIVWSLVKAGAADKAAGLI